MELPPEWRRLVADHSAALDEFVTAVRQLAPERWDRPLADGKWTPAEVTSHLAEAFQVLRNELAGKPGMQILVPGPRRWILRGIMLPRLLRSGRFPAGVRAPRETRPRSPEPTQDAGLVALGAQASGFIAELEACVRQGPVRLTHAYFGSLDVRQALRLSAVHTRHHARQLGAAAMPD